MPPILSQDSLRNFLKTLQLVGQKVPKKCMKLFVCPLARVVACSPVLLFVYSRGVDLWREGWLIIANVGGLHLHS